MSDLKDQLETKFAQAVYREFKQKRFGLTPCCFTTLSDLKIQKELSDWESLNAQDLTVSTDINLALACSNDDLLATVDFTVNQVYLDSIINRIEVLENVNITNNIDEKDLHYTHIQSVPSTLWTIEHNLNKLASVRIEDADGNDVIGEIDYVSTNKLIINFVIPVLGKAYLN